MIIKEPQPLSITESGGKIIANNTLKKLINILGWCNSMTSSIEICYSSLNILKNKKHFK